MKVNTVFDSWHFLPICTPQFNQLYAILIMSRTRLMAELIFIKIDGNSLPTVKEARMFKREQEKRQKLEINSDSVLSGW